MDIPLNVIQFIVAVLHCECSYHNYLNEINLTMVF